MHLQKKWIGAREIKIISTGEERTKSGQWREIPKTEGAAEAIDQLFGYACQEWDKDAKLQNNNARWYDPHTGRFISQA